MWSEVEKLPDYQEKKWTKDRSNSFDNTTFFFKSMKLLQEEKVKK